MNPYANLLAMHYMGQPQPFAGMSGPYRYQPYPIQQQQWPPQQLQGVPGQRDPGLPPAQLPPPNMPELSAFPNLMALRQQQQPMPY